MTLKDFKSKKSMIKVKRHSALRKDQEQLLEYYAAMPAKDRKDVLKFMKMISNNIKKKN